MTENLHTSWSKSQRHSQGSNTITRGWCIGREHGIKGKPVTFTCGRADCFPAAYRVKTGGSGMLSKNGKKPLEDEKEVNHWHLSRERTRAS